MTLHVLIQVFKIIITHNQSYKCRLNVSNVFKTIAKKIQNNHRRLSQNPLTTPLIGDFQGNPILGLATNGA